jgi:hypothetical protein
MPLQLDYFNKLILVTSPDTETTVQVLADFIEDQMASPEGMVSDGVNWDFRGDVARPEGKLEDANNPGVFTQIILQLNPDWQLQFWGGSGYTTIRGGKLIGGLNGEVIKATGTAGDVTVLETQVDGTVVATGSGLDAGQDTKLTRIHDLLDIIEGTLDHQEVMRILLAAAAGQVAGANTTNVTIRDQADTKDRIDATVDEYGNRTAVTVDAS